MKRAVNQKQQAILQGMKQELDAMIPLVNQVLRQTTARVFRGVTDTPGKIVSVFEPTAEIIRKGKASKPTEFGKLVKVQEAEINRREKELIATVLKGAEIERQRIETLAAAEKQRLVGVIPNFYTSYIYDAAPLTWKQKFSLAVRGTLDPVAFIGVGFAAGIEQANNSYAGYGQGAAGYSKRYAAKFVDGRSSDFLTHAVFPSLFHQDPRYYYQGSGTVKSRLVHAVSSAFVTRSDSGHTVPNYSYLLGNMCAGALSNLYYPQANRGAHLVFTNTAIGLAGRLGTNLVREFLSKRLTTNVSGNGRQ